MYLSISFSLISMTLKSVGYFPRAEIASGKCSSQARASYFQHLQLYFALLLGEYTMNDYKQQTLDVKKKKKKTSPAVIM